MSRKLQKVNRLTTEVLNSMSDEQLQAIADGDPHDLSGFTDQEISAIATDTGSPELMARVAQARCKP